VCDPRQIASLPLEITDFPLIVPPQKCSKILDSGEWTLHRSSVVPHSSDFDVIQWWVSMKDRLFTMIVIHTCVVALHVLRFVPIFPHFCAFFSSILPHFP